jgi:hypothetical protein
MTDYTLDSPLRDLTHLPEKVEAADYVIKLDEGVARHTQTVKDYVVTDAIADAVAQGLDLVAGALARQSSRGAFLDGSFGAGKSHYMAVLHLLLSGSIEARQIPGLEEVVARRQNLLEQHLLVVDYNLLGARSFEDAIFRGYTQAIARLHPDAPRPVLHVSDTLLDNARQERAAYGDDAFFARLGGAADTGWGDLASPWDAASFDAAAAQAPGDPDRDRLVSDLIANVFTGYDKAGEWLPIKDGLHALTTHAKNLGYQGVVFLIDEIVLWLGQHLTNPDWVQGEIEKVVQLAENAATNLPIPIASFLARQRDLRDFVGTHVSGAQRVAQGQLFSYWEDRFAKIRLQAADLPRIVKQRLLQPVDQQAADTLRRAVTAVKQDGASWGYLLADDANSDEQDFADVYPFSPALVDTMIALSSLMQRERTALKLMAELLAQGRDTLRVRDVIPVGDLYAPIVLGGSQPLTEEMQQRFRISARFYTDKMRPYLLGKYGLTEAQAANLPRTDAFATEDRLAKTVLIAALAPGAKSLANLTAGKLAALNWGTIDAFVPGAEAEQVIGYVRRWASEFGEISVGDTADPVITATPSGVDYDSVLDRVRVEDNQQARRELIRSIISEELHLPADTLVGRQISHVWRGHKRIVTVRFGNVRDEQDVLDSDLIHDDADWRVIIDFPYDTGEYSPAYDLRRLEGLRDPAHSSNTIAWVPNFLSEARQKDLGQLVLLEYLLTGNRFDQNANHLPASDRAPARQTLESKRRTLREVIGTALRQAYGVNVAEDANVGSDLHGDEIFSTLKDGLTIQPPPTGSLLSGLEHALDTAWAFEFPDHPDLGTEEFATRRLNEALDLITETIESGGRKAGLNARQQHLAREVVAPMRLGVLNENVLVVDLSHFAWHQDLARFAAEIGPEATVGDYRARLSPWGMTRAMEDAVLITWAQIDNSEFAGVPDMHAGSLPDAAALQQVDLPEESAWQEAQRRAGGVFGLRTEPNLTPRAVRRFADAVRGAIEGSRIGDMVDQLKQHAEVLGIDVHSPTGRLATAQRVAELTAALGRARNDTDLFETLATFDLPQPLTGAGSAHASAAQLAQTLQGLDWDIIAAAQGRAESAFVSALRTVREAAAVDESIVPLQPRLTELSSVARSLLVRSQPPRPRPEPPAVPTSGVAQPDEPTGSDDRAHPAHEVTAPVSDLPSLLKRVQTEVDGTAKADQTVTITWQVR